MFATDDSRQAACVIIRGPGSQLRYTENNVCQCLSSQGEGYSWSESLTRLACGGAKDDEQLWVVPSLTQDGHASGLLLRNLA